MGVYIKHWSLADWKELLKWAKIGANNAMIGEFTEVEELPPHGRLIDADVLVNEYEGDIKAFKRRINDFPQAVENNIKLSNAIDFRRGFITVLKHSPTIIGEDT